MLNIIPLSYLGPSLVLNNINLFWLQKEWCKRFYVLCGATPSSQARLDFYETEEAYKRDPSVRKTIYVEEIKDIQLKQKGTVHQLELVGKTTHTLTAHSLEEIKNWQEMLQVAKNNNSMDPAATGTIENVLHGKTTLDENIVYQPADEITGKYTPTNSDRWVCMMDNFGFHASQIWAPTSV